MIYSGIFGTIKPPSNFTNNAYDTLQNNGLVNFISNLIYLLIIIAGLYAVVNFIIAGYLYITSYGNPQQLSQAATKILQTLIGLIIIAAAFVIAGIIGYIFFKESTFLFQLKLFKLI